jgi:hypothetical protein
MQTPCAGAVRRHLDKAIDQLRDQIARHKADEIVQERERRQAEARLRDALASLEA